VTKISRGAAAGGFRSQPASLTPSGLSLAPAETKAEHAP
jgi:hypothetical protein